jgi:hypothetical protein
MGIWETFCPLCGLPCGNGYLKSATYLNWLDLITILTAKNQKVQLNLRDKGVEYKGTGTVYYKNIWYMFYKPEWPKSNHYVSSKEFLDQTNKKEEVTGQELGPNYWLTYKNTSNNEFVESFMMHTNCYKVISDKLKYDIKFCDLEKVTNESSILNLRTYGNEYMKYATSQFFNFESVSEDTAIISDPLKNKENENRIVNIWTKFVTKFKKTKCRPSPSMSATLFEPGVIKFGNDGNLWIINKTKSSKVWVKLNDKNVELYFDRIARLNNKSIIRKTNNTSKKKLSKNKSKSKSKSRNQSRKKAPTKSKSRNQSRRKAPTKSMIKKSKSRSRTKNNKTNKTNNKK